VYLRYLRSILFDQFTYQSIIMEFYKIFQHVHHGNGIPATTWYTSADTKEQATLIVRELNYRNAEGNNDPSRIPVTYSIGC
jgi:hypothetical protein